MIEVVVLSSVLGAWYLVVVLFGYHVAVGHVDRLLDVEAGDASPQLLPALGEHGTKRALSAQDVDGIDDWDRWK